MRNPMFFILVTFLLQGCGLAIYAATETASLSNTKKTASDHILSFLTGDDCSVLDYQKTGHYCHSAAEIAEQAAQERNPKTYCYRQLSGVNCYVKPDPLATTRTQ